MNLSKEKQSASPQGVVWGFWDVVEKGRVFTAVLFLIVFPFLFFLGNSTDKTKVEKIEAEWWNWRQSFLADVVG